MSKSLFKRKGSEVKVLVQECNKEGMESLLGQSVLLMCANYFYSGKLIGVNKTCVKLEDPKVVYDTGKWDQKDYSDAQSMNVKHWYVRLSAIESFGMK